MKHLLSYLLIFSTISSVLAQSKVDLEIGGNYYFDDTFTTLKKDGEKVSVQQSYAVYDPELNGAENPEIILDAPIEKGLIVRIIDMDNGIVYFNYWNFKKDEERRERYNNHKIFSLSIEDFSRITTKRYNKWLGWRVKPFSVPIRLRGSGENFEFETNLSLGTSIAMGWSYNTRRDDRYFDLSVGIGITKINLSSQNSNIIGDIQSPTAFTLATGVVWHFSSVNAGLFLGWDRLSGAEQKQFEWKHNKKPWLGLGINIGLSSDAPKNDDSRQRLSNKTPK